MIFQLKAVLAGGAAALLIGGGWTAHKTVTKAKAADEMKAAQAAHVQELDALQIQLDAEVTERLRLSSKLDTAQGKVRYITKEIIREVPKYVKDSTDTCDRTISPDAVRLLNAAARGVAASPASEGIAANNGIDPLPVITAPAGRYPTR